MSHLLEDSPHQLGFRRNPSDRRKKWLRDETRSHQLCKQLRRFLVRQVGRKWLEICKELDDRCRALPVDREIQLRARRRLLDQILDQGRACRWRSPGRLYIDQATGRLCLEKLPPRPREVTLSFEELKTSPVRI